MTSEGGGYWDAQERVGSVRLSARDTLIVSRVRHADAWYIRLQVHRSEVVDGVPRSTPGQRGVILPAAVGVELAALLQQAGERPPRQRAPPPEADDIGEREP